MARSLECLAHVHHSPVPIERHHVQPLSRGGPDVKTNLVTICCNAHSDVHYLLALIEKARGYQQVPEKIKRSYGHGVRRIALRGWAGYQEIFLAGGLWREVGLWTSDGAPRDPSVPTYAYAIATADALAARAPVVSRVYADWCRSRLRLLREGSP